MKLSYYLDYERYMKKLIFWPIQVYGAFNGQLISTIDFAFVLSNIWYFSFGKH